jgi:hypothetical protein
MIFYIFEKAFPRRRCRGVYEWQRIIERYREVDFQYLCSIRYEISRQEVESLLSRDTIIPRPVRPVGQLLRLVVKRFEIGRDYGFYFDQIYSGFD